MSLERSSVATRGYRAIILVVILSVLVPAGCGQVASAEPAYDPNGDISLTKMNFHMYTLVYSNSNSSVLIYSGAETNPPTYATPVTGTISCGIRQSAQPWFPAAEVWFGGVSWITQPLAEDMTIQGNVNMTVWMSTPDQDPIASDYAFGLSETDNLGNPIGESPYQYYYSYGSVLGRSPAPFNLLFHVNRTFTKGHIIGFFVVVGATTQSWGYRVYFDSPSMNSFAELPILTVPIPEFSQAIEIIMAVMVLISLCVIGRSRNRSTCGSR